MSIGGKRDGVYRQVDGAVSADVQGSGIESVAFSLSPGAEHSGKVDARGARAVWEYRACVGRVLQVSEPMGVLHNSSVRDDGVREHATPCALGAPLPR